MKNTLLLGTAWTASAFAAVGLGFLAVSLVDASASPGTVPAAATDTSAGASAEVTPSPAETSPHASGEQATVGGTAYASCSGGSPDLAGAPATGWWVDDSDDPGEVEFKNGTQKVEVHVTCTGDSPRFSVEGPRADDSGGDDDSSTPAVTPGAGRTGSSYSPSTSPSADHSDDSDGRHGGGHGSDDGPGDDSGSGNSGSGNSGSDDSGSDDSGDGNSGSSGGDSGSDDSDGRDGGGHGSDD